MVERLLQLDDVRHIESPEKIAVLFQKLGYNSGAQLLNTDDLQLPSRSVEAIYHSYMIANQGNSELQVLLFHLKPEEWNSPSVASGRMKAIANSICQRETNFLLLGTKNYNQLMLVNPRKNFDKQQMRSTISIRKLLIDRTIPTNYDRDRLESIAARNFTPLQLYQIQCEAFDVDKLTKSFYRGYKSLFEKVQDVIKQHNPHPYFEDSSRLHQFSQRLLGRIMFLYFLQKKEFLAGDRRFLTEQYKGLKLDPDEINYYAELLEPLFFETLNQERDNCASKWGVIPYLNGGLFDRDYGKGIKDAAGRVTPEQIELPNSLFDPSEDNSILGFFKGYNFTIAENVAGDEDVAVDPEMLGKVFENMLVAEERGQSGTFYTPRGIVQFMCVEVLSRYLSDSTGMSLDDIKELMELDADVSDSQLRQLLTKEQTRKLTQALDNVKILDPAVGSGAFPLGMMQVIIAMRQVIARREGTPIQRGSLAMTRLKRNIIANNLYGVDIKPEAIEIAKLRMWLSLVVDIPNIEDVEPLPNLDYKLMCGDSLISTIHGERLIQDSAKIQQMVLDLDITPVQLAIRPLLEFQMRYFDAQPDERQLLRRSILEAEINVFRAAIDEDRQYWLCKQQEVERKVNALKGKVTKILEEEGKEAKTKLTNLDRFAFLVESKERSLNFFQYHLHFYDVFKDKGGFDIVIGNPPYVGQKGNKAIFDEIRSSNLGMFFKRGMDLFYFFFHLALDLLRQNGYTSYITTNYFLTADSADILRKDLKDRAVILELVNFGELRIFQSAKGQHNLISFFKKSKENKNEVKASIINTYKEGDATDGIIYKIIRGDDEQTEYCEYEQIKLYDSQKNYIRLASKENRVNTINPLRNIDFILELFKNKSEKLLGDIFEVTRGIESGADKVTNSHIEKGLIAPEYKDSGIYILSQEELNILRLEQQEMSIIRPYFKNSDIKRYFSKIKAEKFLIYATRDLDIEEYPTIFYHLKKFEDILKARNSNRGEMQAALKLGKWWVVRTATKNSERLKGSKIVVPKWSKRNNFSFNDSEWFAGADVYFITQKYSEFNLKYLLALLNSTLYFNWLYYRGKRKGKLLEIVYTPLTEIPIPKISLTRQETFIQLVDKILTAKSANKNTDTSGLEAEIDKLIYQIYDFKDEEISIIEEINNKK